MKFTKHKTVDSIMSTFNKTIQELNDFASSKFQEASEKSMEAVVLESEAETANHEGNKALEISQKLSSITK